MAAGNWKSRAETLLSQFININHDDALSIKHLSNNAVYLQDNSSASNYLACGSGVYDRLLGCDCSVDGPSDVVGNGPCVSVVLAWVKLVLGRVIRLYLSNPLLLAFVPLFVGVGFGFLIGRWSVSHGGEGGKRVQSTKLYNWWKSAHEFLLMVFMGVSVNVLYFWKLLRGNNTNEADLFVDERDEQTRQALRVHESTRTSGVDPKLVPRHIAVIMDGNRRYGKTKYGNATRGHWDGSKTLIEFTKWCMAEGVKVLTVYAFSTENWDRDPNEVSALMSIFCKYCEEIRLEALQRGIRIHVLETESERIPADVREGINRMVSQTRHCDRFTMNICMSYGARGEIVNACKSITQDVMKGVIDLNSVGEMHLHKKMLTGHCCDPDVIIRTSGEERLSNFLLWQSAYSELFFLKKPWPEMKKEDLVSVICEFAKGRERRYGK